MLYFGILKISLNYEHPHRRYNPLTSEWVLGSPHRTRRPWRGKEDIIPKSDGNSYDSSCCLGPGNERAGWKKIQTIEKICFTPKHNLTLSQMEVDDILNVINV